MQDFFHPQSIYSHYFSQLASASGWARGHVAAPVAQSFRRFGGGASSGRGMKWNEATEELGMFQPPIFFGGDQENMGISSTKMMISQAKIEEFTNHQKSGLSSFIRRLGVHLWFSRTPPTKFEDFTIISGGLSIESPQQVL